MVCSEQKQEYFDFFERLSGVEFAKNDRICFASVDNGQILAVVVFNNFTKYRCEISVVSISPKFLTKRLLKVCCHYAFFTAGKERINVIVAEDNVKSLKFSKRLGCVEEGILKNWFGTKSAKMLRMLKSECRFLDLSLRNSNAT